MTFTLVQRINLVGLLLGFAGAAILFIYGFPQPPFDESVGIAREDSSPINSTGKTVAQHLAETKSLRSKYEDFSKIGFFLVGVGFALQLGAIVVEAKQPRINTPSLPDTATSSVSSVSPEPPA